MKKTGIVLSGGGARCFAHLGLLKILDECCIKPYAISGVSGGALIGALYAAGKSPMEILEISRGNSYFGFSNLSWRNGGLFTMESIQKVLEENIPHDSFENLKIPLFVNATDFKYNKTVFFSKGKLIKCLVASSSVPVLFDPVELNNSLFVDGGLLNNLPVEPLLNICDKIIGSHVNRLEEIKDGANKLSRLAIVERCFHMAIASNVYTSSQRCHLLLEPRINTFGLFDVKDADKIFEIGYQNAKRQINEIMKIAGLP